MIREVASLEGLVMLGEVITLLRYYPIHNLLIRHPPTFHLTTITAIGLLKENCIFITTNKSYNLHLKTIKAFTKVSCLSADRCLFISH